MSTVKEAAETLEAALKTVPGIPVYRDPGAEIRPPAFVLGPPSLQWETGCAGPNTAQFVVWAVELMRDRAIEGLWELVPKAAAALDATDEAVVIRADPSVYPSGSTDLPAYELVVEVAL